MEYFYSFFIASIFLTSKAIVMFHSLLVSMDIFLILPEIHEAYNAV
jgi:hypothetical protein